MCSFGVGATPGTGSSQQRLRRTARRQSRGEVMRRRLAVFRFDELVEHA